MKFYAEFSASAGRSYAFEIEASSSHIAFRLCAAFMTGWRYGADEPGTMHIEVVRLGCTKARGVQYEVLG